MVLEHLIKVKSRVFQLLQKLFGEGEEAQVVIPCGRMDFDPATPNRPSDRDYLILTNRRLIQAPGAWFQTGKGAMSYPRTMIIDVETATYLLGCTITFHVQPMGGGATRAVVFPNCGKPEAEQIKKMFSEQHAGRRCPGCGRTLQDDFTFCPFCKASLKRLCRNCGRPLQDEWANCPYCGA